MLTITEYETLYEQKSEEEVDFWKEVNENFSSCYSVKSSSSISK